MIFTLKPDVLGWPRRIICLTAETTEIAFALGAGDRIVGVSGYSVRPPEARQKEKVAAFTSVRMDKIRALQPDLILGFSDLQKDILRDLVGEGFNVFVTNQRTLSEVGEAMLAIGRLLGAADKAEQICREFFAELDQLAQSCHCEPEGRSNPAFEKQDRVVGRRPPRDDGHKKPRVYFEEWDDPLISGISWVSELIEKLGGEDVFKEKASGKVARQRTVSPEDVIRANPDIMIASWCGKKVQFEKIKSRPGWEKISAVRNNRLYEIKSTDILQPGLSLMHGARQMAAIFRGEAESLKTVDGICQSS
ncbi:MAG: cobalamin-binding protein [Candidatus Omnitrophica bacterium]|nr:cobalamin-binding protein [Candidatus Omnitrophota bacterium]